MNEPKYQDSLFERIGNVVLPEKHKTLIAGSVAGIIALGWVLDRPLVQTYVKSAAYSIYSSGSSYLHDFYKK